MKNRRVLIWLVPLILLLLLVPFLVPSALPYAGAEEAGLPVYTPVELENPNPDPLPIPNPKEKAAAVYAPDPAGYVYDDATQAAWEYRDGTISVRIETRTIRNTKVLFTWIQIADPKQLQTGVTRYDTPPDKWTRQIKAIAAINGDWYSGRKEGRVFCNGVELRNEKWGNYDALIIDDQGDFHILYRPDENAFAPYEGHILQSFVFGPAMVIDGVLQEYDNNNYGSGPGMGLQNKTQRQALCQMDKLSYLILTTEGPNESKDGGFTMEEFAKLAYDVGAKNAYNMDGGSSATLILNNTKMNRFGKGGMRPIYDLVYFVTAEKAPEPTPTPEPVTEEGTPEP